MVDSIGIDLFMKVGTIGIPASVTIHGDTAHPEPYAYDVDEVEFYEYDCFNEKTQSAYCEIRVHPMLVNGKVYIRALVDGDEFGECYVEPTTEAVTAAVRSFEEQLNKVE